MASAVVKVQHDGTKYLHTAVQQSSLMSLWKQKGTEVIKRCYYNCNHCNLQHNVMYTILCQFSVIQTMRSSGQEPRFLLSQETNNICQNSFSLVPFQEFKPGQEEYLETSQVQFFHRKLLCLGVYHFMYVIPDIPVITSYAIRGDLLCMCSVYGHISIYMYVCACVCRL